MKNQKGITLVALVITIIVLLILAGVSISLVVGQNGVLNQASNAVNKQEQATVKQDVEMAVASCTTDMYAAMATNTSSNIDTYLTQAKLVAYCDSKATVTYTKPTVTYVIGGTTYTLTLTFDGNSVSVGDPVKVEH